jgi:hypothetical protein
MRRGLRRIGKGNAVLSAMNATRMLVDSQISNGNRRCCEDGRSAHTQKGFYPVGPGILCLGEKPFSRSPGRSDVLCFQSREE